MARIDQFNAASSEGVLSQMPAKATGEEFNLLHGAGPNALPATLGTSQGNSNPVYSSNKNKVSTSQPSPLTTHGVLVQNLTSDNYTSNSPALSATTGAVLKGLTAPIVVPSGTQQAWIGNNVFGKPTYGEPEVQISNFGTTRDDLSFPSNNNNIKTTTMVPNVGSRLYRA